MDVMIGKTGHIEALVQERAVARAADENAPCDPLV
jgi:hypothetical protein